MLVLVKRFLWRVVVVGCFVAGAFFSVGASASCDWGGASIPNSFRSPIVFQTAANKMLGNKLWYEDSRYPTGSYMGMSLTTLTIAVCRNLRALGGHRANVVYMPPPNGVSMGAGFRIPTSAPGVAIDIEFPDGVPHSRGVLVATSAVAVPNNGTLLGTVARFPNIPVKMSVVKTGAFADVSQQITSGNIRVDGGLGSFGYFSAQDANIDSATQDQLQLPERYGVTAGPGMNVGSARAPSCRFVSLGNVSLGDLAQTITMNSVSTNDFAGIGSGAITRSAKSQHLRFACTGTSNTKPAISFDASYPFNAGINGVGLPRPQDDIGVGVQILLNDSPVTFNVNSSPLLWNDAPLDTSVNGGAYGQLHIQGAVCRSNCDVDMSGPNWGAGGASSGTNEGLDATVTFKYYRTGSKPIVPGSISVPFTVTLDVL